jgi:HEAT repeat protein
VSTPTDPPPDDGPARRRRDVVIAGHRGDATGIRPALADAAPSVRDAALGALDRCGVLSDDDIVRALDDPDASVRRRAVELASRRPGVSLVAMLDDPASDVVELAAWASGEQLEQVAEPDEQYRATVDRLGELAIGADDALVREAAAAALGAIGDPAGLPAILHACADKPQIRRRAVLALAPFDGPEVDAAIEAALTDRDWQVRQAAEDLRRAAGHVDT